ncbi:MAG: hypothetical protein FWE82_05520 [Defluviitaleaceae bacterium]|nr:hypothetical protein [Defluviitaleaceae bacterium]
MFFISKISFNNIEAEYQLTFEKDHLFANINGGLWLIDTGAPVSFGNVECLLFCKNNFPINKNYYGFTAETVSQYLGVYCTGLLGVDLLNSFDIIFHAEEKTLFASSDVIPFNGKNEPLDDIFGIPIINVNIKNMPYRMIFDTGAQISYFQSGTINHFPTAGIFNDFHLTIGRYETETYNVPMMFFNKQYIVRCGTLPEPIAMTIRTAKTTGIVGCEILRECVAGYFPRRRLLAVL